VIDDPPELTDRQVAELAAMFDKEKLSEPFFPKERPWFTRAPSVVGPHDVFFFPSPLAAVRWLRDVGGGWLHDARRFPCWHVATVDTGDGSDDGLEAMLTAGFEPRGQEPHPRPDLPADRWRYHKEPAGGRLLIAVGSDAAMFWEAEVRGVVRRPRRLTEGRLGPIEQKFGPVQSAAGLLAALRVAGLLAEGGAA
jgi:hypothetical protein